MLVRPDLPQEIWKYILSLSDLPTLLVMRLVEKKFQGFVTDVWPMLLKNAPEITFDPKQKLDYHLYSQVVIPIEHAKDPRAIQLGKKNSFNASQVIVIDMPTLGSLPKAKKISALQQFMYWFERTDKNFDLAVSVNALVDKVPNDLRQYDARILSYYITTTAIPKGLIEQGKIQHLEFNGELLDLDPQYIAGCKNLKSLMINLVSEVNTDAANEAHLSKILKALKENSISLDFLSVGYYGKQSIIDLNDYIKSTAVEHLKDFEFMDYRIYDYGNDETMDDEFYNLLDTLSECKNLQYLYIQYELNKDMMDSIFWLVEGHKELRELTFNFYDGEIDKDLFTGLRQVICETKLKQVNVEGLLSGQQLGILSSLIHKNAKLSKLILDCSESGYHKTSFKEKCKKLNIEVTFISDDKAEKQLNKGLAPQRFR